MNTAVLVHQPILSSHNEQMNAVLMALTALRRGDPTVRLPVTGEGTFGKVSEVFNELVEQSATMAEEVARLSQVVGKEGKLKRRAALPEARGFWAESVESVNALIDDLVHPTSEVARVIGAVAQGDLSQTMALEIEGRPLEGEFLRTAKTVNRMVDQLGIVRVRGDARRARGRHRRQARRPGEGEGRRRHVEGPHRQRELDGRQPDGAGAQHRRRDDRRRERATCRRRSRSTSRARSSSSRTRSTRWSTSCARSRRR